MNNTMSAGIYRMALMVIFSLMLCPTVSLAILPPALLLPDQNLDRDAAAVSTTTLINKTKRFQNLQKWFEKFSETEEVANVASQKLNGYEALSFDLLAADGVQRGVALNFGQYVLLRTTADLEVSPEKLAIEAKEAYRISLKPQAGKMTAAQDTCQCVWYARSKVPLLPYGLNTYNDKEAIINHLFPQGDGGSMSSVAVHKINGDVGHVSVVTGVRVLNDGNLRVYITEKNYSPCAVTTRDGTMEALKITGYFDPRYYNQPRSFPNIARATYPSVSAGTHFTLTITGSGFDTNSMQAILLGGNYCKTFTSCVIPNNHLIDKSSSGVKVPLTINSPGKYRLYIFNANQGKTTFGHPLTIN